MQWGRGGGRNLKYFLIFSHHHAYTLNQQYDYHGEKTGPNHTVLTSLWVKGREMALFHVHIMFDPALAFRLKL